MHTTTHMMMILRTCLCLFTLACAACGQTVDGAVDDMPDTQDREVSGKADSPQQPSMIKSAGSLEAAARTERCATSWDSSCDLVLTFRLGPGSEGRLLYLGSYLHLESFEVDWDNDGIFDDEYVDSRNTDAGGFRPMHGYDTVGLKTIRIRGPQLRRMAMCPTELRLNGFDQSLVDVVQWGGVPWLIMDGMFSSCELDSFSATDIPDTSRVVSMQSTFAHLESFNHPLEDWDVSSVTDMSGMFAASAFDQPLERWDVSQVTDMGSMFTLTPFDQPLEAWDVSQVTDMSNMFYQASAFNQPLEAWDVSQVTTMSKMFYGASSFDQPLEAWDVSQVTDMTLMLARTRFSAPLARWDVSQVTSMQGMFAGLTQFDHPLDTWDVSSVRNMQGMFRDASSFNQPLDTWDVSRVTNMGAMFQGASSLDQPLDTWDVSSVVSMSDMFRDASSFNQPLDTWDVSNVSQFLRMFLNASSFNQPLDAWTLAKDHVSLTGIFGTDIEGGQVAMTRANYELSLAGWLANGAPRYGSIWTPGTDFHCHVSETREILETQHDWNFSWHAGGLDPFKGCVTVTP